MQSHSKIEGWPALLTLEAACRYLSLEAAPFRSLTEKWGIHAVDTDSDTVLWRLRDLDLLVKRLPAAFPTSATSSSKPLRLDRGTIDQIAHAVADLLGARGRIAPHMTPQLIAIKDAMSLLNLGRTRIYQLINDGTLRVRRIGRRTLITRESIQALLDT